MKNYFAHKTAEIDQNCIIGEGTKIWHFSHIMSESKLGKKCNIGQNVVVAPGVVLGNNVKVQNNVSIYDNVILEDDVFCGPSMVFTNVYNPRSAINRKNEYKNTIIRHGATLGANCTLVCGIEIGTFSFIAAGSLVNRNVKPYALMTGIPARQIGWMNTYGERVELPLSGNKEWKCPNTGEIYKLEGENLTRST